ncbi:MAG: NADH-quinone oxidoreductase subunit C [Desulfobacterales bacterium]
MLSWKGSCERGAAFFSDPSQTPFSQIGRFGNAIDESARREKEPYPDFTLIYSLPFFDTTLPHPPENAPVRRLSLYPDCDVTIWPSANWYEQEVFDMFGVRFEDIDLHRIFSCPVTGKSSLCANLSGQGNRTYPPYTLEDAIKTTLDGAVFVKQGKTARK